MTTQHKIITHEDWKPGRSFESFTAQHLSSNGLGVPPLTDSCVGTIRPYVNSGRWVADCKTDGCAGAMVVSDAVRFFMCAECGNQGNNGNWYRVVFPQQRRRIEELLLRRPALKPTNATTRNWNPDETVEDLERENVEHGLDGS
tara:strand:- start:67 stop:498 length:432 start_codon:yes stop_codon:yes gene_type:complete